LKKGKQQNKATKKYTKKKIQRELNIWLFVRTISGTFAGSFAAIRGVCMKLNFFPVVLFSFNSFLFFFFQTHL